MYMLTCTKLFQNYLVVYTFGSLRSPGALSNPILYTSCCSMYDPVKDLYLSQNRAPSWLPFFKIGSHSNKLRVIRWVLAYIGYNLCGSCCNPATLTAFFQDIVGKGLLLLLFIGNISRSRKC